MVEHKKASDYGFDNLSWNLRKRIKYPEDVVMIKNRQQGFKPIQFISLDKGKAISVKYTDSTKAPETTPVSCSCKQTEEIQPGWETHMKCVH